MSFFENIENIDKNLFLKLNSTYSPFFDNIMESISGTYIWIPLYLLVTYLLYRKYGMQVLAIIPIMAIGILLSDKISVYAFKDVFERFRPCHNLELKDLIHTVNGKCGGTFGFVSSHAANTFMFASLSSLFLRKYWFVFFIFFWAALVSYSRIYLGVHYPLDIAGGALLGILIGGLIFKLYKWGLKKFKS